MAATLDIPHLRQRLRDLSFRPYQLKSAELGGGQDQPFEQAFSNLAHAYIRDKAPKLLDFEVGFQLIEKNQDNTKAVGVFGFKVGNQWLYAPVFFLNGDLKGHELLYVKSQDVFVPLKENWLNYLLGRRQASIGEGMNRNLSLVGVMPPNLYQLTRSPHKFAVVACRLCGQPRHEEALVCGHCGHAYKVQPPGEPASLPAHGTSIEAVQGGMGGSGGELGGAEGEDSKAGAAKSCCECCGAPCPPGQTYCADCAKEHAKAPKMASWASNVMPDLAYFATQAPGKDPKFAALRGLPDLLKEAGEPLFRHLVEQVGQAYPTVLRAVDQCYGPAMLEGVARGIALQKRAAASTSIMKESALAAAGEPPGQGWNGSYKRPSKDNGGEGSYGVAALDSLPGGHQGLAPKKAHYPGCKGYKPRKRRVKKGSVLAELLAEKEAARESRFPDTEGGRGKVKVVTSDAIHDGNQADLVHDLSKDEREVLMKERVVVRDHRDDRDVTIAYSVQTHRKLWNPTRTNVYNVLVKPAEFKKCLVVWGPYDRGGANTFCTVVDLDSKRWTNIHPSKVWVESEYDDEAWRKWYDKLGAATSLEGGGKYYLILTPTGQGTVPCTAVESYGADKQKTRLYDVKFSNWCDLSGPFYQSDYPRSNTPERQGAMHGSRLRLTGLPGKKVRVSDGEVAVPDGSKLVSVKAPERKANDADSDGDDNGPGEATAGTEPEALQLGNTLDVDLALAATTTPLRLFADGTDVTFDRAKRLNKVGALRELIVRHGLREKAARELISRAEQEGRHGRSFTCLLKYARPGAPIDDMVSGAPNSPPFPEPNIGYDPMTGSNVPTMGESEFNVKVPDMSASRTDRSIYQPQGPDPRSMQIAQQAARTGQREVFDTAMLGSMLKAVRQPSMVERYLGDLMKGVDRLGRILFLFYWHGEEFEDRYGKQDMPELEDGLRNSFEAVGDILLALKRKTVDPYPDEGTDTDLSAIANQ
jgi:hypothetical protein